MRRTGWLIAAALAGCGGAGSPAVMTGDPLPAPGREPEACRGFRWLGAEPHVPLAVSRSGELEPAGECCRAWAGAGGAWTAIDAYGAPVGEVALSRGEGYDVTACWELAFEPEPAGAGILVRGDEPWTAPASARWEPGAEERAAALELAASIDRVFAAAVTGDEPATALRPLEERVLFFEMPGDAHHDWIATRFMAMGGRALVIAGLDRSGAWRVHHLDNAWAADTGGWLAEPYRVRAIVDMDRDGYPEVIFHRSDGPSWDDSVLRCRHESTARPWELAVEGVGGATI
jgi:hypothetical protein